MQTISKPFPPFPPESLSQLLRQWSTASGAPPPAAERLGSWLGWADAIEISQVLSTPPGKAKSESARTESICWASTELEKIQAQLVASFNHSELAGEPEALSDGAALTALLAPYLQHFAQQQRLMESRTAAFRAHLRANLTRASDELARLAQLDEYIERAVASPQLRALTGLSAVLETQARKHYAADPLRWRARLWSDLQRLLRAELDHKLQAVLGLIEALSSNNPP